MIAHDINTNYSTFGYQITQGKRHGNRDNTWASRFALLKPGLLYIQCYGSVVDALLKSPKIMPAALPWSIPIFQRALGR